MEQAPEKCILCQTSERDLLIEKDDWKVYWCPTCGLGFLDPRPTREEVAKLYDQEYFAEQYDKGIDPNTAAFRKRLSQELHRVRFFRGIKRKGRVLDIGCGNGYFLAACRDKGYDVQGLDISEWIVHYALNTHGISMTTGEVDEVDLALESFDVITMWHFLEHTRNPCEVVLKARTWLKKDGILVIDVPNYNGTDARKNWENWVGWQLPYHFYHFSSQTLERLIDGCGFKIIKRKDYHSETVKNTLKKLPIVSLFARLIAKMYSGTSVAVIAKLENCAGDNPGS